MARASAPAFTPGAITFLRRLKRHNDREWFRAHKADYLRLVREPLEALLARIDQEFRGFAPELVAAPAVSLFRIHRDTRFSADKSPLKTQIGAVFPDRRLPRKAGAGLYLEIGPDGTLIAGGLYAPTPPELRRVRLHVAETLARLRAIVRAPSFVRNTGGLSGARLVRVPRGFAADHPAAEYLRYKQYLAQASFPADFATTPAFVPAVVRTFRAVAPLVTYLNDALLPSLDGPGRRT